MKPQEFRWKTNTPMTELPTAFWTGWIAVLTLVSLAFLGWFVFSIYFSKSDVEHKDLVWDSNLREGSSPAPMWWFWLILASLVFSVIYLMLYPCLGSHQGLLNWRSPDVDALARAAAGHRRGAN